MNVFDAADKDNIVNTFIGGQPFGFALALRDGIFKSTRFSGIGAKNALEEAMKLRNKKVKNKKDTYEF